MVTLNTSPGDGGVSVGVDAFGAFGSNIGGTETSDAIYDPIGATEAAGTVFESYLAVGINGDEDPTRTVLSENILGASGFTNSTPTNASSAFNVSGLDFVLEQEVTDFVSEEQRVGSDLLQTYTITNNTNAAIEFDIVRYLDGDLNFDGSVQDTGGLYFEEGNAILFETDSGNSGTDATSFVGITSDGTSEYQISRYSGLKDSISLGEPLTNTVEGDGDDEDQFVDSPPYDVTLGLSQTYTLAPGESIAYETATYFGSGAPKDLESEIGSEGGIATDGVDIYRFSRTDTQTQFYTASEVERDSILNNLPQYELEGVSFVGAPSVDPLTGTSPVYRFFNQDTGIHLYTADENERAFVEQNLDNYVLEGTPYYGYDTQVEGTVPLYRFYNANLDAHFYTPNAEERDSFLDSPNYVPEGNGDGIAFYVEPPTPEL